MRITGLRAVPVSVTLIGLALLCGACSSGSSKNGATSSDPSGSAPGSGQQQQQQPTHSGAPNGGGQQNGGGGQQSGTQGTYTLAFARCMRAHGVPTFPDPSANGGLSPGTVDLGSAKYLAALNGPCKSLAPAGWVQGGGGSTLPPLGGQ